MSLLSTSSTVNQQAFLYENHYPQPIVIAPNSQICLQKFIHYRGALYEVTSQNNTIGFRFGGGGGNLDVARFVDIPTGSYDAASLADAFTDALNSVNQQQNYEWTVTYIAPAAAGDDDQFQIQYASVPTPTVNSGVYNTFDSGQLTKSGENQDNNSAKITYNGFNADHYANVISKRSTLVYLGEQSWSSIQPNKNTEIFQPIQFGLVREKLSNPANVNPNLQFTDSVSGENRFDISLKINGNQMQVVYGKQRQGSIVGNPNWFVSEVRRNLVGLYDAIFKPGGTFSIHTKLECKLSIYASAETSRRVLIQLFKKEVGETTYTALADGFGGNSPIGANTPFVKTLNVGADTFPGLIFDSNDPTLNDSNSKINQHYPKLSVAPFFPVIAFEKSRNQVASGYDLDQDTWTNNAATNTVTFQALTGNTNGYDWKTTSSIPSGSLNNYYWKQIDPVSFDIMSGDIPLTNPPQYTAVLDPTAGNVNPNGQIVVTDQSTNTVVQIINFDGVNPVVLETAPLAIFTQGIFNTIEPVQGLSSTNTSIVSASSPSSAGGLGVDLKSRAILFLRGSGGGVEADVGNLLGFSQNEEDFGGTAQAAASVTSDIEPDTTANNNTLHISIPEMPLVKSFEGENSAEAKSISIIPREEFSTGDNEGSLVYVAPFENWIDINNGQELNINLITTLVRNADGSLADNLQKETQAIFKIRQDPMKFEEDKKAERFREMAEMMANTINTGLTNLITPQQLIGS